MTTRACRPPSGRLSTRPVVTAGSRAPPSCSSLPPADARTSPHPSPQRHHRGAVAHLCFRWLSPHTHPPAPLYECECLLPEAARDADHDVRALRQQPLLVWVGGGRRWGGREAISDSDRPLTDPNHMLLRT